MTDAEWFEKHGPPDLYYLKPVQTRDDLPADPDIWNAVWVIDMDDLMVFAFGRWLTLRESAEKLAKINKLAAR